MRFAAVLLVLATVIPTIAMAETAYITDKLYVSIREGQGNEHPAVKSIVAGTEVEVLQRLSGFTLVREPGGAEGWVADRYLVDTAPAKALLESSDIQIAKVQADLASVKKQLTISRKTARVEARRAKALEQKLQSLEQASAPGALVTTEQVSAPETRVLSDEVVEAGFRFHWLWFLIAFAMLITGFISGAIWLREVNRKKMGGMYLRI